MNGHCFLHFLNPVSNFLYEHLGNGVFNPLSKDNMSVNTRSYVT